MPYCRYCSEGVDFTVLVSIWYESLGMQDYTGSNVTVNNFLAAILGNKDAIKGGSGKVVASGPNDHVFIFYTDHGGPGVLGELQFLVR